MTRWSAQAHGPTIPLTLARALWDVVRKSGVRAGPYSRPADWNLCGDTPYFLAEPAREMVGRLEPA